MTTTPDDPHELGTAPPTVAEPAHGPFIVGANIDLHAPLPGPRTLHYSLERIQREQELAGLQAELRDTLRQLRNQLRAHVATPPPKLSVWYRIGAFLRRLSPHQEHYVPGSRYGAAHTDSPWIGMARDLGLRN